MVKKHYKVVWQDEARASLRKIYNYIKKRESKEQATRVRSEIKKQGDSLGFMPRKYTRDPFLEKYRRDIRFKAIWSYKLVYEVTEEAVVILDVIHTSRNPENMKLV
ncbi:MAG TPA: type II toxin-antitoxin system RelE/ParE family toxin [Bacteroides sp.]|nr:type II toxin-antitoxin system RelE/ParE family toxin [Bacteroides sp.]